MTGLTGTDADAVVDLTLSTTTVEFEEYEVQDPGLARPGTATAAALIPPPPVHHHPRTAR
ncbi:MAG: hypothetical protein ACRDTH_17775 [Pseudonocardiaceae bacterium]